MLFSVAGHPPGSLCRWQFDAVVQLMLVYLKLGAKSHSSICYLQEADVYLRRTKPLVPCGLGTMAMQVDHRLTPAHVNTE